MMTIRQSFKTISAALKAVGIESAEFDAAQLVEHATGISRAKMPLEGSRELTTEESRQLSSMVQRRKERYPLQYLLGQWEFYGLPMKVGEGVLIPRPDTEILVETGLELLRGISHPVVYDLCSGSGCIAAAIASQRPDASVYAVELSQDALPYLRRNTSPFPGITVVAGDVTELAGKLPPCHLLLSNPPYLSDDEMQHLQTEVTFEPELALRAANRGLYFYQSITGGYYDNLLSGGAMAFEVGYTQSGQVSRILEKGGLSPVFTRKDYSGIDRVVAGVKGSREEPA